MSILRRCGFLVLTMAILWSADLQAEDSDALIQKVARKILEADGFSFFSLSLDQPTKLVIEATLDGKSSKLVETLPTKSLIVAVKVGKGMKLLELHAYYDGGSAGRRFGDGYNGLTFANSSTSNPIELGRPFMTFGEPQHHLELQVTAP